MPLKMDAEGNVNVDGTRFTFMAVDTVTREPVTVVATLYAQRIAAAKSIDLLKIASDKYDHGVGTSAGVVVVTDVFSRWTSSLSGMADTPSGQQRSD